MTDREKLLKILIDLYPGEIVDTLEQVADYMLENGVTFATDNNDGHNLLQENEQMHVMQKPVAVTMAREHWIMVMDSLKFRADYHHAQMLETLANCQDKKMGGEIARGHQMTMEHAESLRKIVEGILYPTPPQPETE